MSKVFLKRILSNEYILQKITEEEEDSVFGTTRETVKEYTIKGNIIPITLEDIRFTLPGTLKVGDARGYFYREYVIGIDTVSVEVNDILKYDDINYRVETINDYVLGKIIFREVYLRRIQEE